MPGPRRTVGVSLTTQQQPDAEQPVSDVTPVDTPAGEAQVLLQLPRGAVKAVVALGHGAGGDVEAPDLTLLTRLAVRSGIAVARVRQPYRVLGRRAPAPAHQLDTAWTAAVCALRDASGPFTRYSRRLRARPLVVSGRSSGARVACRTASACGAAGVVALAFPLHPPGRPENSRASELSITPPLIVVQGSRDAFGRPSEFPSSVTVVEVDGSDHGLRSPAFAAAAGDIVAWMLRLAGAA